MSRPDLSTAASVGEAAQAVADFLVSAGLAMPSVYISVAGRLRCIAQRGYWQVHDGVPPEIGILGATFRSGEPTIIQDVRQSPDFIAAGEGVIAEVGFPLRYENRVVAVLNVESDRRLSGEEIELVRSCGVLLERRIAELGGVPEETAWQRLAREAAVLIQLQDADAVSRHAVERACALIGMSSALLVPRRGDLVVAAAHGPLGPLLAQLESATLASIASWSGGGASVYTFGTFPGVGFTGSEQVWDAGVAALVCVPLTGPTGSSGFLLVADGAAKRPTTEDVQVLELFAAHVASGLRAAGAFSELRRQATRDVLTGLGHNAAFHARLEAARASQGRRDGDRVEERPEERPGDRLGLAVMVVDLDSFKRINDRAGHLVGDRALTDIAKALGDAVRDSDLVFRIGGDEFAAVVPVAGEQEAAAVGERLRQAVSATGHTTVSIGVAYFPPDQLPRVSAESLRSDADLALYEAKRKGRNRVQVFDASLRDVVIVRARLAAQLAGAIQRDELFLVYQPVVDLASGAVIGAETLVRWNHPQRGLVPPLEFIGIAEEDGQIHAIGAFVLREACRQAAEWKRAQGPRQIIRLGVNVSGEQLGPGFAALVAGVLSETGLPADALVIEITESALADDPERIAVLSALRELGAHVAVDDFGTGYSSLSYLRRLPIDIVKIDRSFVAELDDPRNAAVARAIVDLARTLDLVSVGEGVETAEQAAQLAALGCKHAQGFWFSPPLGAEEFRSALRGDPAVRATAGGRPKPRTTRPSGRGLRS